MSSGGNEVNDGILTPALTNRLLPFLGEVVCVYDLEGRMTARVGPPGGLLGHGAEVGTSVYDSIHPDDLPAGIQIGTAVLTSPPGWSDTFRLRLLHGDGEYRRCELRIHNFVDDPEIAGMVICIREAPGGSEAITTEVLASGTLASSLADALPTPSLVLDVNHCIRHASPAASALLALSREELFGLPLVELVRGDARVVLEAALTELRAGPGLRTVILEHDDDRGVIELEIMASGTGTRTTVTTVVLTDRSAESELVRLATRDELTGLPNRGQVVQALSGLLADPAPAVAVIYCDIDRFKVLNDACGHDVGDQALVAVASQLRALVRPTDLVGRMGGDEFVIVCPGLEPGPADELAHRITSEVLVRVERWRESVRLSAGAAIGCTGEETVEVLRRADARMFEVKRRRRNRQAGRRAG